MNNSNYAAEQILESLKTKGWMSAYAYDESQLIQDIASIIASASVSNITVIKDSPTRTADSAITSIYTFNV